MKKLILGLVAISIATFSYAASSSLNKGSATVRALGSAWKAEQTSELKPGHDINIVYGGEDVSSKNLLVSPTAIA